MSYYISRLIKKPVILGKPAVASIEPGTACNLRCPQCPSGLRSFTRPTGMIDLGLYNKVLSSLGRQLHSVTLYFQGEPFLHPSFDALVSEAKKRKLFTITSTNAHHLTPDRARQTVLSGLDKLIVSIDGVDQDTYAKYRVGGQLEKVIEGTKNVLQQKRALNRKTPHVVWQFVVFKHNENQIEHIKQLGKKLGVDQISIKTAQVYDFENSAQFIPDNKSLSRYKKNASGQFEIKNKLLNHCWRMWQGCVVTWDGKVVPCCFDKDAQHTVGNMQTHSFDQIWHSADYQNFRYSVLTARKELDICKNCSEGTAVFAN